MVDSIGASHASGGMLLHAPADATGARASLERDVPRDGPYKVWARYEYPFRDYHVRVGLTIEQPGRAPVRLELGAPEATRTWFFKLPDAPWHDLPHGVEGLVAEAAVAELAAEDKEERDRAFRADLRAACCPRMSCRRRPPPMTCPGTALSAPSHSSRPACWRPRAPCSSRSPACSTARAPST